MLNKLKNLVTLFKKVLKDMATAANGEDYDPARVIGYGIVLFGGIEFLILTAYVTITKGSFDGLQFATGLVGVGGALTGAAAGVWLKHSTEVPPVVTPPIVVEK